MKHAHTAILLASAALPLGACRAFRFERGGAVPPPLCQTLAKAEVVAIGESHDKAEHHAAERDALLCMLKGGGKVLLGMEMFQRGFQEPLDDYVAGRISENEMLRRTEYFARWNFDWTLYAPLWRTAREHGVRIVALNVPKEISTKVGREGLDALPLGDRFRVAQVVDLTVPSHRKRIRGVFEGGAHPMPSERVDKLYEAQTLWDETMAESAAKALDAGGPGARMLVVAGSYHIQERDGIPDRIARRRPGAARPFVIVLREPGRDDDVPDAGLGDVVLRPRKSDDPAATKLGIALGAAGDRAADATGLPVLAVPAGGAAAKAGILAGDVITSIAGKRIRDMTDYRYALDPLAPGDEATVGVLRGGAPLRFTVTLRADPK